MAYFYRAGNLEGGLVEETAQIGIFASKSPDIDQDANMTPEFFQHLVFGLLARKFFHRLLTLHPRVRAKKRHWRFVLQVLAGVPIAPRPRG